MTVLLKQFFVGSRFGAALQRARELQTLASVALRSPEALGCCGNDMVADLLLKGLCRADRTFVDVGAHIGSVIDRVCRGSSPQKVIAFEAVPAKARALKKRFPQAIIHACAVGEQAGELPFYVDVKRPGYSSLFNENSDNVVEIIVPVQKMDDLIADHDVDVIKIDVEGAELGVLRGGVKVIRRGRPTIMFESGPQESGGYTKPEIWSWFEKEGYLLLLPNRVAHNDDGMTKDAFLEAHLHPRRTTNYFAVANERREEIRVRAYSLI